jgi:hypothetical protein
MKNCKTKGIRLKSRKPQRGSGESFDRFGIDKSQECIFVAI